ncbi:MAG: hypothetical protein ACLU3F_09940 [Blautia wexlerae]
MKKLRQIFTVAEKPDELRRVFMLILIPEVHARCYFRYQSRGRVRRKSVEMKKKNQENVKSIYGTPGRDDGTGKGGLFKSGIRKKSRVLSGR